MDGDDPVAGLLGLANRGTGKFGRGADQASKQVDVEV
jgi:hypothetical protein